ncbi:unnamed protein product [Trichobilharzia szidati]|nr:unnamed protein product [Trichobilharzia szidati]CAH8842337.1 unnamed protein product [Trichobilharzia szidati]CAH8842339.1 unnamed protein product [Trichobilharzia szidati]
MQSLTGDVVTKPVGQRLRYSRAEVLARYDYGKTIAVEYDSLDAITKAVTGIRVRPKTQRKKTSHSQSSDGENNKTHVNEDLTVQETDPNNNTGWHRKTRHAVNAQSGHVTNYPHQRRPSGPTGGGGDVDTLNSSPQVSGPLRPANEIKRGGHGDWSRGCAGWRQRSYSGSEQSDVYHHNYSNHRGRGNGHEPDGGVTGRGGRGRGRGRQAVTYRDSTGTTGQSHNSNTSNHRPVSCLADVNPLLSTETRSVRAYSKSFSIDPPPGFELPVHENIEKLSSSSTLSMGGTLQAEEFLDNNYPPPVEKITSTPPPNDHLQLLTMTPGTTTATTTSTEVGTTTKPYHLSSRTWYYVDLLKHIQGPFTDQQMATWLAAGYLSLGVKIRRNCDECFLSLADHMNLANRVPFWSGYNQPPITHENLSSITSRLRFNENLLNAQISFPETPTTTTTTTTPNSNISGNNGTNINQLCSNSIVSNRTDNPAVVSPLGSTSDESQTQLQQEKVTSNDNIQVESVDSKQPTSTLSSTITSSPPPPAAALHEDLKTSTSINPSVLTEVNDTTALLNLCTDAQNILTHTTKIEAERLALANKLAEINNTTAKLLSNLCSSQLNSNLTETLIQTTNAVQSELARLLISPSNEANGNNSNQIHSNNNNNNGSINKRDNLDTQNTPPQKPSLEMTTTTAHNNKSSTPSKVLDNTHQKDIRGSGDEHICSIDEKINSSSYDSKDESSSIMLDSTQLTGGGGQLSHHEDVDATGDDDDGDGGGENVIQEKSSINTSVNTTLQTTTTTTTGKADSSNDADESGGGGVSKKSKRKNKKANKKLTAEQEKQLAWEIEFNRRKAAALEQKLAEEARLKKIAEEEALALAMEKALADQEKARALAEQSRREALRMKADSELSRLKLPESARWAAGSVNTTEKPLANDLRSIQAAQEAEEEEKRRHRLLLAEQMSALTPSPANVSSSVKPTLAWSEIAKSETHSTTTSPKTNDASKDEKLAKRTPGVAQPISSNTTRPQKFNPHQHHTINVTSVSSIKSVETSTPPGHISSLSSVSNIVEMKNTTTKVQLINSTDNTNNNTTTKKCQSTAPIPSIWDLPVSSTLDNTTNSVGVKKASNKKKKKNCSTMNSFTVKEELVHWCESQLSSMPLSGIDLPTLVDLLCDLQTSDEIVEFIETSLGRSKRVTKFSKDFLQKRALLLNVAIE